MVNVVVLYFRQALQRQLHGEKSEDLYSHDEFHIINTDRDVNVDAYNYSSNNNNSPPNHYAPVTSNSYHDFNILADPLHHHDKLQRKELSLRDVSSHCSPRSDTQQAEYSRSVSAPPNYSSPYTRATAPSEDFSVVIEEEETCPNMDENSPLHIPTADSVESNNLSV